MGTPVSRPPYCTENCPSHSCYVKWAMTSYNSSFQCNELRVDINGELSAALWFSWYRWNHFLHIWVEIPNFHGWLSVLNSLNPVDCTVNDQFKSSTNLVIMTRAGGFRSCDPQHTLSKNTSRSFSYAHWTNASLFVKRDQVARHKCMIGRPGRAIIGYPVDEKMNTSTKYFDFLPEF